jgi:hypothetical protein
MHETFQAILDSLPPKPARSKLEPYTELIQELRRRGRSYREIAGILADRCGVPVGVHTLYNFVRVRTAAAKKPTKAARATVVGPASIRQAAPPEVVKQDGNADVWQRIQALKDRSVPARAPGAEKVFEYDENAPLTVKSRKTDV